MFAFEFGTDGVGSKRSLKKAEHFILGRMQQNVTAGGEPKM
jgi:hypothetical protein